MFSPAPLVLEGSFYHIPGRLRSIITDHTGKTVVEQSNAYLNSFNIDSYAVEKLRRIIEELARNHADYNQPGYEDRSRVSVVPASDGKTVIVQSTGIIAENYFETLEARVNYTRERSDEELGDIIANMNRYGLLPNNIGPRTLSKGHSLGIIYMAHHAHEKLTLERGNVVAPGLFEFTLTCPYRLYYPIRLDQQKNSLRATNELR